VEGSVRCIIWIWRYVWHRRCCESPLRLWIECARHTGRIILHHRLTHRHRSLSLVAEAPRCCLVSYRTNPSSAVLAPVVLVRVVLVRVVLVRVVLVRVVLVRVVLVRVVLVRVGAAVAAPPPAASNWSLS
jgi:hypothetical protein